MKARIEHDYEHDDEHANDYEKQKRGAEDEIVALFDAMALYSQPPFGTLWNPSAILIFSRDAQPMANDLRDPKKFSQRPERFVADTGVRLDLALTFATGARVRAHLADMSLGGMRLLILGADRAPTAGARVTGLTVTADSRTFDAGPSTVQRAEYVIVGDAETDIVSVVLSFDEPAIAFLAALRPHLRPYPYVTNELLDEQVELVDSTVSAEDHTILDFYRKDSPDMFEKCRLFSDLVKDLQQRGLYQALYRVTLTSGLDHRITVFNPIRRTEDEMICFDSNSYLGLHLHPRVTAAVKRALYHVGYGTPSAQLLCGTNRYLRELEETVSRFHGREDAVIFPSGYAANVGALTALVREKDLVVRDRFSHASIHDGCRHTGSRFVRAYAHDDLEELEEILTEASDRGDCMGKLIVTDGVFSMHGKIARLPELVAIARKHGAKLMVDEAHATGVIGPNGRGTEDLYGLAGSIDVLMGTFSKAPGTIGGYVTGSREVVTYLRFYATTAMFTASLPAALCAGVIEAYRIMETEPEHRERLWKNIRAFVPAMRDAGFLVPTFNENMESAIVTVFMGSGKLLWRFSRDLFDGGVKCGNVAFPAVPRGEAIVRMAMNARHTDDDLARTLEIFKQLGKKYDILHRSAEGILEVGDKLSLAP